MTRKIVYISVALMTLILLAVFAAPSFAADPPGSTQQAAQGTQPLWKARVLVRLLMVQDEAKVDAFLTKALDNGKLTEKQASRVKDLWAKHHARFARAAVLGRLLRVNDEAKVDAFLDRAVQAQKLVQPRADRIKQLWDWVHGQSH